MDPTRDAKSWSEFLVRSRKQSEERLEQLKKESLDSSKISEKYHINQKKEEQLSKILFLLLVVVASSLTFVEYKS